MSVESFCISYDISFERLSQHWCKNCLQNVQVGCPIDELQNEKDEWENLLTVFVDRVPERQQIEEHCNRNRKHNLS